MNSKYNLWLTGAESKNDLELLSDKLVQLLTSFWINS